MNWLADALYYSGEYSEALTLPERVLSRPVLSTFTEGWTHHVMALALDGLGREEEARAHIGLAIKVAPGISTLKFKRTESDRYLDQEYAQELMDTWRRLGMPEE